VDRRIHQGQRAVEPGTLVRGEKIRQAAFSYAEQEYQVDDDNTTKQDDRDVGAWIGAGMYYYTVIPKFVLGPDVRYSYGRVDLFDQERNAGGVHTCITAADPF
jgi:hypothetical protein